MIMPFGKVRCPWSCECAGRQVSSVLRDLANSAGNNLRLDPAVWQSMLAVVDTDDNGKVEWDELVQFMCDVFKHIEREQLVSRAVTKSVTGEEMADVTPVVVEPVASGGSGFQTGPMLPVDEMKAQDDAEFGVARTSLSQQRQGEELQAMQAVLMDVAADGAQKDDTADTAQTNDTADAKEMVVGDGETSGDVQS